MKERIILSDVDGVLLNWDAAFNEMMKAKGYAPAEGYQKYYRLNQRYPQITDEQSFELVHALNTSERISRLEPFRDSVEYVTYLRHLGFEFICVTALSDHLIARKYRQENLDKVFGPGVFNHSKMICLSPRESKYAALQQWAGTGLFWIEDHFGHAESGHELGLKSLLMDNPYNQHYKTDLFPRVHSWKEIYEIVRKDYNL